MATIQLLAVIVSKIDTVHFYTHDSDANRKAQALLEELITGVEPLSVKEILRTLFEMGFQWGKSDSN